MEHDRANDQHGEHHDGRLPRRVPHAAFPLRFDDGAPGGRRDAAGDRSPEGDIDQQVRCADDHEHDAATERRQYRDDDGDQDQQLARIVAAEQVADAETLAAAVRPTGRFAPASERVAVETA